MKFAELFNIRTGVTVRGGYKKEKARAIRIILPKDIKETCLLDYNQTSLCEVYYGENHLLREDDILFCTKGTIKAAAFRKCKENYIASSAFLILTPNRKLSSAYIAAFLNSEMMKSQYRSATNGATIPSLPLSYVKDLQIDLPSLKEQEATVELLDLYNKKLDLLAKRIDLETKTRNTLFKKIFTGDLKW